jgi:hypothetical protein
MGAEECMRMLYTPGNGPNLNQHSHGYKERSYRYF